jgi:DNA methylase
MNTELNAICPYFTMYPLDFPLRVLPPASKRPSWVFDPFCGRGTTNFAARLQGLPSVGFDSSPVAVAVAAAKLVNTTYERVVRCAEDILNETYSPSNIPSGMFWRWAFNWTTLVQVCRLREELIRDHSAPERLMLRAIMLGALHGPLCKGVPSYCSNQCPRTFAPKPAYAVKFWKKRKMVPPVVDVLGVIVRRAERYLSPHVPNAVGSACLRDSRDVPPKEFKGLFSWVVTSPPYYGMRTYLPDQWLRGWFLGGPSFVDYSSRASDFEHSSPERFTEQLRTVWKNTAEMCRAGARLVCRFGGIHDRKHDCLEIAKNSFAKSGWRLKTLKAAGNALNGRRQATQFRDAQKFPREEYDLYARLEV